MEENKTDEREEQLNKTIEKAEAFRKGIFGDIEKIKTDRKTARRYGMEYYFEMTEEERQEHRDLILGPLYLKEAKFKRKCKNCKRTYGSMFNAAKERKLWLDYQRPEFVGSCRKCNIKVLGDEFFAQRKRCNA